jgi:glycosyltransferase involved in cell wall biosynthesis
MKLAAMTSWATRKAGGMFFSVRRMWQSVAELVEEPVTVMALEDEYADQDRARWEGADLRLRRVWGPARFGYSPGWLDELRRLNPDVLHLHGLWMYPSLVARRWGGTRVVSPHGMLAEGALRHSRWKKALARGLYEDANLREAACLHAFSEAELARFRRLGLSNPVAVVPNGVDLPELAGTAVEDKRVRRCVFLGRLHPTKGLAGLLRTWEELRPPGWELVIAGWDEVGFEAELKRRGVAGVSFPGPVWDEDKDRLLRSADAFVLPSLTEGMPMSVLEAWAYGLPVAMTEACNLGEGFEAGSAVRIGSDGEGLETLLRMDPVQLQAMGKRGRRLVEARYGWDGVARAMVEVYAWLAGRAARPSHVDG